MEFMRTTKQILKCSTTPWTNIYIDCVQISVSYVEIVTQTEPVAFLQSINNNKYGKLSSLITLYWAQLSQSCSIYCCNNNLGIQYTCNCYICCMAHAHVSPSQLVLHLAASRIVCCSGQYDVLPVQCGHFNYPTRVLHLPQLK